MNFLGSIECNFLLAQETILPTTISFSIFYMHKVTKCTYNCNMLVTATLTQYITSQTPTNGILLTRIASHLGGKEIIHASEGFKLIHSDQ